jgi:FeS assembly SUF system regulator
LVLINSGSFMLRITKEADYGVIVLADFANHPADVVHAARESAARVGLPLPMVSKILRTLARQGLLKSHRGALGGYSLAHPAKETSVAQVIRALEGPISLVQCGSEPGACEQEGSCLTRLTWARINEEVEKALERVMISDMLTTRKSPLETPTSYPGEEAAP